MPLFLLVLGVSSVENAFLEPKKYLIKKMFYLSSEKQTASFELFPIVISYIILGEQMVPELDCSP